MAKKKEGQKAWLDCFVYYKAGISDGERQALWQKWNGRFQYVIHHSDSRIQFNTWPPEQAAPAGQAFGPTAEMRWWPDTTNPNSWQMLLASEQADVTLGSDWVQTPMQTPSTAEEQYLWGNHWHSLAAENADTDQIPDGWVQAEIPADLQYPLSDGGRNKPIVKVQARTYYEDGIARLTRFVTIQARADDILAPEVNHGA